MFKRLTDFLFKEEEVIIEEEVLDKKKEWGSKPAEPILKVEPLKPVEREVSVKPAVESFDSIKDDELEKPKKRIMIDLDERPLRPMAKTDIKRVVEEVPYTPKEIISPMYGGSTLPESTETKPVGKSRQPLTKVISPIYGAITQDNDDLSDQKVYDMSLEDLIQPDLKDSEDVQVSLFDVLQEREIDE